MKALFVPVMGKALVTVDYPALEALVHVVMVCECVTRPLSFGRLVRVGSVQ